MMMSRNFNRRHSPNRRKTRVAATMILDGTRYPVTVRNVSYRGMLLAVPMPVALGNPITLCLLDQKIPAIVRRSEGLYIGVHLLERLEGQTLRALENAEDELAAFR